ncbi:hypothetical protein BHE74_00005645 [Ensete ventricosum]|nr:hypothetical protein BHE74_00005645 [Ensete ventricosum]
MVCIRQYRRLDDGSLNVVARGQQRFRLRRRWVDAEGAVSSAVFMPFGPVVLIAKRSDMLVMSSDGPLNAYVNPHGFVHETITVCCASGLALRGRPDKEHSWFPGYGDSFLY